MGLDDRANALYEKCCSIADSYFGPYNVHRFKVYDKYGDFLMKIQNWNKAIEVLTVAAELGEYIYQKYFPSLGLIYFAIGKTYWYIQDEKCKEPLAKSVEVFKVCFGPTHPFTKEVENLILEVNITFDFQKKINMKNE